MYPQLFDLENMTWFNQKKNHRKWAVHLTMLWFQMWKDTCPAICAKALLNLRIHHGSSIKFLVMTMDTSKSTTQGVTQTNYWLSIGFLHCGVPDRRYWQDLTSILAKKYHHFRMNMIEHDWTMLNPPFSIVKSHSSKICWSLPVIPSGDQQLAAAAWGDGEIHWKSQFSGQKHGDLTKIWD